MQALQRFYTATEGVRWSKKARWLQGEPCTDRWEGVTCCPEDATQLAEDRSRCINLEDGSIKPVPTDASEDPSRDFSKGGCHSGAYTGQPSDRARCVVVALDLDDSGLRGPRLDLNLLCELRSLQELRLPGNAGLAGAALASVDQTSGGPGGGLGDDHPGCMSRLRALDLSDDGLTGELPTWLADPPVLTELALRGNSFTTPILWSTGGNATATGEAAQSSTGERMQAIVTRCRSDPNLACDGLPPTSCEAFGPNYKLRTEDPTRCTYCDPDLFGKTVGLLIAAVVIACAVLGAYVMLISGRYAEAMNRWVSTLSLFFAHLQTVAVIGNLALDWPPRVKAITGAVSLSIVSASFLRPEVAGCVHARTRDPPRCTHAARRARARPPHAWLAVPLYTRGRV